MRVLKFDGAMAPRVLKFDSGYAAEGCGRAPLNYRRRPLMIKPSQPPCGRGRSPLWCLTAPPSPRGAVGLWMLSHGAMSLQESIERFILSPGWGESPAQPDKGEPRSG